MRLDPRYLKLMLDTSIWLDYFIGTEPHCRTCAHLLEKALEVDATLLVSPTTLKDVFYILPRRLRLQEDHDNISLTPAAWGCIEFILDKATPTPLSVTECSVAHMLRNRFNDFEDNLLLASAETAGADYIVTYDASLLSAFPEVFITPRRALELLGEPTEA